MLDLHAHTTASDGTLSPRQLVAHAREKGLRAVGVTDHDTIAGWPEALAAGEELGIEIVPGIELSVEGESGRFHLLGYYLNPNAPLLKEILPQLQQERAHRNQRIIEKLNQLGYAISMAEVKVVAGSAQIGRPHFAQVLVSKGFFDNNQQVFDQLLGSGQPAALPKKVLHPRAAIEGIHQAGGVAIWAHPPLDRKNRSWDELEIVLQTWISWGVDGLESWYFSYTPEEAAWTSRMAQKYHLIGSGGSDFHGTRKANALGQTHTGSGVPEEVLEQIKAGRKAKEAA